MMDSSPSYRVRIAGFCLLLVLPVVAATAQPTALPARLSFEDARTLFLRSNPELKAARANAEHRTQQARIPALWPNPALDARRRQVRRPRGGIGSENTVTVEQSLRYPNEHRSLQRAADAHAIVFEERYTEEAAALYRMLRERYAETQAARLRLDILWATTEAVRRALHIAEVRYEEGDIGTVDRARLRVARATYEDRLEEAQKDDRDARIELAYFLQPSGHADHHEIDEAMRTDSLVYRPLDPEYDALVDAALDRRGLLAAAEAEHTAREQTLHAARYARLPEVGVAAGYRAETQPGVVASGFTVGLRIGLPVFHQNQPQVRAAEAGVDAARYAIAEAQRRVELDVHDAYERLRSYERRIENISGALLPDTGRLLDDALYVYEEGEISLSGLLDTIEAARTARLLHIDLLLGHALSRYDLERALGVGPTDTSPFGE